jgi:hypothetical protein
MRARNETMQRPVPRTVRSDRDVDGRRGVREPVQRRRLRRNVQPRSTPVQRARGTDVRPWRHLAGGCCVRKSGVCLGRVSGCLHTGFHSVLEQRRADVRRERTVGHPGRMHEPSVRCRRLHGRVPSRRDAVLRQRSANVRPERPVRRRGLVRQSGVRFGSLHRHVLARRRAMHGSRATDLQRKRRLGERTGVRERVQWRWLLRNVQSGRETM